MKKKPVDKRRKLITTIAVGSGVVVTEKLLPNKWAAPVVEAVMLPAHAATTQPEVCGCQTTDPTIDLDTNSFTFSYSYSGCQEVSGHKLEITGPRIDPDGLAYIKPTTDSSDSKAFQNTEPYNNSVFQPGSTYTFTVTVFTGPCCVDITPLSVCVKTFTTPDIV